MNDKFLKNDNSISKKDFDESIKSLIDKGLVEQINLNNQVQYKLTDLGDKVSRHINSNPKIRN